VNDFLEMSFAVAFGIVLAPLVLRTILFSLIAILDVVYEAVHRFREVVRRE
jgi:hypothetical protein